MFREYLRTLAVASLALSVVAVPGGQTFAKIKHPPDNGVRCAYHNNETGEWEFYLPNQIISIRDTDGSIQTLICGEDGNWHLTRTVPLQSNGSGGSRSTFGAP